MSKTPTRATRGFPGSPLGSPAPSIPSPSWKNIPKIYTASGEVANETSSHFPSFEDGDVLIISSIGHNWILHSATLRHFSTVLRVLIDSTEALRPNKRRKEENKSIRWRILMEPWNENPDVRTLRSFSMVDPTSTEQFLGQILAGHSHSIPPFYEIYNNLFRCMYDLAPKFSSAENGVTTLVTEAAALLNAAEFLGAGPTVRMSVEANFLRLDQRLFRHIARHSPEWCDLALRLRSGILFRAAMAHLVGRFDLKGLDGVNKEFLRALPNGPLLLEFAGKKSDALLKEKQHVERLIVDFYPPKMHHPEINGVPPIREAYTNDIYHWQALTLIRQYFMSAMLSNMHHRAPDGGMWFYHLIEAGGEAYLRKDMLEDFHEKFGMSAKGKECLRTAVYFMKEEMRDMVAPLLVDHSGIHRDPEDPKPRYLTCCEIEDGELPWMVGVEKN